MLRIVGFQLRPPHQDPALTKKSPLAVRMVLRPQEGGEGRGGPGAHTSAAAGAFL